MSRPPKTPPKVHVEYPHLSAPNDGYDENGLWCGMTQAEVKAFCEENKLGRERRRFLEHWVPTTAN